MTKAIEGASQINQVLWKFYRTAQKLSLLDPRVSASPDMGMCANLLSYQTASGKSTERGNRTATAMDGSMVHTSTALDHVRTWPMRSKEVELSLCSFAAAGGKLVWSIMY